MRKKMAAMLSLPQKAIGIKATTTESVLPFSKKGIAAYCVVMVRKARTRK